MTHRARMMHRERRMVRLANYRGRWYWSGTIGWILWFVSPLVPGWLTSRTFAELERNGASSHLWVLCIALAASEIVFAWWIFVAHRRYMPGVEAAKSLARANVLSGQLASGGPTAAQRSVPVGDALVRLRDDPFDTLFLIDTWVDMAGSALFGGIAAWFLLRIDVWAAVVGIGPLLLIGLGNYALGNVARRYRSKARASSSTVSAFLAAAFEASLTVKVNGAQPAVLRRLDEYNARRAKAAVKDDVWNDIIWTVNSSSADIFVGLALVVAARGSLDAGEVTLFAVYLLNLVWLPMRVGGVIIGRRRYDVSIHRLDDLVAPATLQGDPLTDHRPMPILGGRPAPPVARPERERLAVLEVRGLTAASRGLNSVDLHVERETLTIISGPVGSGKTSLLRAIIGQLTIDEGEVLWNGRLIDDRAAFFIPPQCAYVAQVPRLFAESLADNLRLGHQIDHAQLAAAVHLAAFDSDVADLPNGMDTMVGARGVRLSGGQAQRAAGARALAHAPELLVLDDLTSALDVETELAVWDRLRAAGYTVIAASNRPAAIERADTVIHLGG